MAGTVQVSTKETQRLWSPGANIKSGKRQHPQSKQSKYWPTTCHWLHFCSFYSCKLLPILSYFYLVMLVYVWPTCQHMALHQYFVEL